MESTASPLKAAPAKLRIALFTFSLLPTSSSRIGELKDFSRYWAEEQVHPPMGGSGQRFRRGARDGMAGGGEARANHAARPENLIDPLVGGTDGRGLFESVAGFTKVA
jgi:hypothetical protein